MGTVCTVEGILYFESVPELCQTVISRFQRAGRLDETFRWWHGPNGPFGDEPTVDFNPVVPSIRIPYHQTRSFPSGVVSSASEGCLLESWPEDNVVIRTPDTMWSDDLVSWARHESSPVSEPEQYIEEANGVSQIMIDHAHDIKQQFFEYYRSVVLEELRHPEVPRVSRTEYHKYVESLRQRRLYEFGTNVYELTNGPAETVAWRKVCKRNQWAPPTLQFDPPFVIR